MRYRIEFTEEQMRVVQKCTEMYFRLLLGQERDFADEISEIGMDLSPENPNHKEIFDRYIQKRNDVQEVMRAVFHIALPQNYSKTDDMEIAECIWDAIRFARGKSRWSSPFHIGPEPTPTIEKIENGSKGTKEKRK